MDLIFQDLVSLYNGKVIKNAKVIKTASAIYLQSYNTIVCSIDRKSGAVTFSQTWYYSNTTLKQLCMFMRVHKYIINFIIYAPLNLKRLKMYVFSKEIQTANCDSLQIV